MNYRVKFFNLITMCIKAGKLLKGFDISMDAVKNGEVFLVMTASDISPKTLKEVRFVCEKNKSVRVAELPFSIDELSMSIGRKAGVVAVSDKGFADKLYEYAIGAANNGTED